MISVLYSETNLDELSMARADAINNAPYPAPAPQRRRRNQGQPLTYVF